VCSHSVFNQGQFFRVDPALQKEIHISGHLFLNRPLPMKMADAIMPTGQIMKISCRPNLRQIGGQSLENCDLYGMEYHAIDMRCAMQVGWMPELIIFYSYILEWYGK
jgi:hypothetical protein